MNMQRDPRLSSFAPDILCSVRKAGLLVAMQSRTTIVSAALNLRYLHRSPTPRSLWPLFPVRARHDYQYRSRDVRRPQPGDILCSQVLPREAPPPKNTAVARAWPRAIDHVRRASATTITRPQLTTYKYAGMRICSHPFNPSPTTHNQPPRCQQILPPISFCKPSIGSSKTGGKNAPSAQNMRVAHISLSPLSRERISA